MILEKLETNRLARGVARIALAAVFGILGGLAPSRSHAQSLPQILQHSLDTDPLLAQAKADLAGATARRKAAFTGHFPSIGVQGSNKLSGNIPSVDPEVVGNVNVWAGGGIQANVRSTEHEELFYSQKLLETRENLSYEITRLYIGCIRIEDQLTVARRDLSRHIKMVDDLGIVVHFDVGREYDLIQAEARKAQVETRILTLESDLDSAQAQLARFSGTVRTKLIPMSLNTTPADSGQLVQHPSYVAQLEDYKKADADLDVAKSAWWPRVDLQSVFTEKAATRVAFNWNGLNFGTSSAIESARERKRSSGALLAAVQLDLDTRRSTSAVNYRRSEERLDSARGLISSSQRVTDVFQKQFQIARRSMIDLLNAYAELSSVESAAATAESDRQSFALEYLHSTATTEVGVKTGAINPSQVLDTTLGHETIDLSGGRSGTSTSTSVAPPRNPAPLRQSQSNLFKNSGMSLRLDSSLTGSLPSPDAPVPPPPVIGPPGARVPRDDSPGSSTPE